ncbi:hypothetical protein C8Q76DRAFT_186682 [Earliella scabrosa]|nr:hypothetical protein C8Q76DRAFT_186682 [Earliella scabrosa]
MRYIRRLCHGMYANEETSIWRCGPRETHCGRLVRNSTRTQVEGMYIVGRDQPINCSLPCVERFCTNSVIRCYRLYINRASTTPVPLVRGTERRNEDLKSAWRQPRRQHSPPPFPHQTSTVECSPLNVQASKGFKLQAPGRFVWKPGSDSSWTYVSTYITCTRLCDYAIAPMYTRLKLDLPPASCPHHALFCRRIPSGDLSVRVPTGLQHRVKHRDPCARVPHCDVCARLRTVSDTTTSQWAPSICVWLALRRQNVAVGRSIWLPWLEARGRVQTAHGCPSLMRPSREGDG